MAENKKQHYAQLAQQVGAIVAGEQDLVANMANISAILYWALEKVNWAGFYLVKEGQLVLGPISRATGLHTYSHWQGGVWNGRV